MEGAARRSYRLKRRAERQAETHGRIIEAAVTLFEEVGASRTTISAIAGRAGVQRLTVYRHFPDEASLVAAVAERHLERHPLPQMAEWFQVRDPAARLEHALGELYAFYRASEPGTASVVRDGESVPIVRDGFKALLDPLAILPTALSDGWPTLDPDSRRKLVAVIAHGLEFGTWRSLTRDVRLSDSEAARLIAGLARTAARGE
jgi:AcrR family transcriptional regulator